MSSESEHKLVVVIKRWPNLERHGYEEPVLDFMRRRAASFGLGVPTFVRELTEFDAASSEADAFVVLGALNPLSDFDHLRALVDLALKRGRALRPEGMVPGTEIDYVLPGAAYRQCRIDEASLLNDAMPVRIDTQARFNNQLNLFKFKRVKMFLGLCDLVPDLDAMSLPTIAETLASPAVHEKLLSYFSPVALVPTPNCPHCGSTRHRPLPATTLQPLVGYVSPRVPAYVQCDDCTLAWLSPQIEEGGTHHLYDEFDQLDWYQTAPAESYVSRYGIVLSLIAKHAPAHAAFLDLGGGIGGFSFHVKKSQPEWEVTHSDFGTRKQEALHGSGVRTRTLNFLREPIGDAAYDVITALEVIEHVSYKSFCEMLENVHRALRPNGLFAFSTPDLDSPLARAFDFFNAYVPHHLLIFTRRWVEAFFAGGQRGFRIVEQGCSADLLDTHESYFSYCEKHSPSFQLRASATLLRKLFADKGNRARVIDDGLGAEMVVVLQKE